MSCRPLYASTISEMNTTFDVSFVAIHAHRAVSPVPVFKYVVTVHPLVDILGRPDPPHAPPTTETHVTPVDETFIVACNVSYPDNDTCIEWFPSVSDVVLVSVVGGGVTTGTQ